MKTNAERFPGLVAAFETAILDQLKAQHPANEKGEHAYTASVANFMAAAWPAFKEVIESEVDPVDPILAVNVWKAVALTNESAFSQGVERKFKAGLTKVKPIRGAGGKAKAYSE